MLAFLYAFTWLNINNGTLNEQSIKAMLLAGRRADQLGHIVLLDLVGAGASMLRTQMAVKLMKEIQFDVIRGNSSEIKALAFGSAATQGVAANIADAATDDR